MVLELPPPQLPKELATRVAAHGGVESGGMHAFGSEEMAEGGPWEDEEMRHFYESLPDLRALVPAVLLGGPDDAVPELKEDGGEEGGKEAAAAAVCLPPSLPPQ